DAREIEPGLATGVGRVPPPAAAGAPPVAGIGRGDDADLALPDGGHRPPAGAAPTPAGCRRGRRVGRGLRDPGDAGRGAGAGQLRPHRLAGRRRGTRPRADEAVDPPRPGRQGGWRCRVRSQADGRPVDAAPSLLLLVPARGRGQPHRRATGRARGPRGDPADEVL
ncbi:MAG: hypothetical protein AVDCRST_MAG70-415, partial [uncultured Thermomicrobiales bacterium]